MKLLLLFMCLLQLTACQHRLAIKHPDNGPSIRQLSPREASLQDNTRISAEQWLKRLQQTEMPADLIQAGDAFNFVVYGEPELELKGTVVRPDGMLALPLIGDIQVAGLTIEAARAQIQQSLGKYLKNLHPTLSAYQYAGRSFGIIGKVNRPGNYSITHPMRVLDAIAEVGGLAVGIIKNDSTELTDLKHAFMVRDEVVLPVDFEALVRQGDMQHNIPLMPADYIYIPSVAQQEIYVLGEVYEQNSFNFRQGMSISQALTYAKGPKDHANLQQVILLRGKLQSPQQYVINFQDILNASSADVLLESGDVVYVLSGPLKQFEQIMNVALPSLQAIQGGALIYELLRTRTQTSSQN